MAEGQSAFSISEAPVEAGNAIRMARRKFLVELKDEGCDSKGGAFLSRDLTQDKSDLSSNSTVSEVKDEVEYQNNVTTPFDTFHGSMTSPEAIGRVNDTGEKVKRRHSSSVELVAMTRVRSGVDAVPVISFCFLQADEKGTVVSECINIDEDSDKNDAADAALELYDFPRNSRPASVHSDVKSGSVRLAVEDDGSINLYDVPKPPQQAISNDSNGKTEEPTNSTVLEDCVYEIPRSKDDLDLTGNSAPDNFSGSPKSRQIVRGSHSDSECPNPSLPSRERLKKYRLTSAWGKMRSWLREEKLKLSEVVQRHARMQAVGAQHQRGSSEDTPRGSRSGSYDLIAARTRELGSLTKVEEFGLASVLEETQSSEINEEICLSHDLKTRKAKDHLNDEDDVKVTTGKSPESPRRRLRKRFTGSESNLSGTKLKLTPVSFSLDKLFDDGDAQGDDGLLPSVIASQESQLRAHEGKGRLIKKRMLGSIRGLMASTHLLQHQPHDTDETGPGGFEDIRRYVKQGGDFCKELAAILHERAELEASYAKGLSKLSGKLTKACAKDQGGNSSGGVNEAWRGVGEEMETAAEAHRVWGIALSEQLAKPLRVGVAEAQGRSRKAIESSVDKASKSLQEWRGIAAKSKKQSFSCARENERLQDLARIQSISQNQQNNNKTSSHHMTEKEVNKLENRRRKAEDSSRRADTEFYTVSVRAERARLEYESTVRKGAKQMELLEEERLSALKDLANVYLSHLQALAPRLQQSADRLATPVRSCSVSTDIDILKNLIRRMDSNDAATVDQLLPDFYAEHVTLAMNRERRKQSLVRVLHLIRQDLERERRGREGLETLHRAFIQTPAFAADESTQNVTEKLHHMRSMLTYLEAARYKVGGALAEVEGGKKGKHPLAEHILVSRDKQGLQQSVLKMPNWAKNESFEFPEVDEDLDIHLTKVHETERHEWIDRTAGDGNSENPPDEEDFSDFDEFSSQSEDNNNQDIDVADSLADKNGRIEQCRAIYQYSANLNDELSLTPGDIITIHRKQSDGWWIGECGGRSGIFPATYVQLIH